MRRRPAARSRYWSRPGKKKVERNRAPCTVHQLAKKHQTERGKKECTKRTHHMLMGEGMHPRRRKLGISENQRPVGDQIVRPIHERQHTPHKLFWKCPLPRAIFNRISGNIHSGGWVAFKPSSYGMGVREMRHNSLVEGLSDEPAWSTSYSNNTVKTFR